jgi:hypothetical protein
MIANELYDGQGLGNQLWNYVVCRVLADKKRSAFSILGREKFKGKDFMDLDFGVILRGGSSPEGGPPRKLPTGLDVYYRERKEVIRGTTVDISRTDPGLLAIPEQTKFDGNCQSTVYLKGYREKIISWLKIKNDFKKYSLGDNACVIHMRCGDFAGIKDVFLPPSYYLQAMKYIKKQNPKVKFYCVTDEKEKAQSILPDIEVIGSATMTEVDSYKASHHKGGPVGIDFSYLANAAYLIIPNSSFSWWAGYINTRAKIIVAPKYWARYNTSDGFWSTSDIITDFFTYLDKEGKVFTAEECSAEKTAFESTHQNNFVEIDIDKKYIPSRVQVVARSLKVTIQSLKKIAWRMKNNLKK